MFETESSLEEDMKQVILGSVAGFASAAAAQSVSLSIVPSSATLDITVTGSFTLSIYGNADFGTAIAGGEFAISAVGATNNITGMTGEAAAWGAGFQNDRGYDGNGGHNGLVFGQLIFPPVLNPAPESALPGPVLLGVMTVTVEPDFCGIVDFSTANGVGDFVLEIFDGGDGSFTQVADVSHGTASVGLIPAPSTAALLGLGGLLAGRRRR